MLGRGGQDVSFTSPYTRTMSAIRRRRAEQQQSGQKRKEEKKRKEQNRSAARAPTVERRESRGDGKAGTYLGELVGEENLRIGLGGRSRHIEASRRRIPRRTRRVLIQRDSETEGIGAWRERRGGADCDGDGDGDGFLWTRAGASGRPRG